MKRDNGFEVDGQELDRMTMVWSHIVAQSPDARWWWRQECDHNNIMHIMFCAVHIIALLLHAACCAQLLSSTKVLSSISKWMFHWVHPGSGNSLVLAPVSQQQRRGECWHTTLSTMLLYETPSIELSTTFRENLESRPEIGMLVYLIPNGFG